jgi:hypothetical protein
VKEMMHTPGPWRWQGEDYRGDWGWQILVGPDGEGLIVGQGSDGKPSQHLRFGMPIAPHFCITGMVADGKPHVEPVHVFGEANARLIARAPEMAQEIAALRARVDKAEAERDSARGVAVARAVLLDQAREDVAALKAENTRLREIGKEYLICGVESANKHYELVQVPRSLIADARAALAGEKEGK